MSNIAVRQKSPREENIGQNSPYENTMREESTFMLASVSDSENRHGMKAQERFSDRSKHHTQF